MFVVSYEHWLRAQETNKKYRDATRINTLEFARITYGKISAFRFFENVVPDYGKVDGPYQTLGVGCIHFLQNAVGRELVGVDPLPCITSIEYPYPFISLQIQSVGGSTELPSTSFALAACYNVLDHTESPKDELKEIAGIFRPGGYLLLECDVLSFCSLLKHHIFRIYNAAHPHKFSSKALCKMVTQSGFRILAVNSRKYELLHQICGKLFVV